MLSLLGQDSTIINTIIMVIILFLLLAGTKSAYLRGLFEN